MAFSLFPSKNRIINLIINDHSIRYVELKNSRIPTVHQWGERFLPQGIITQGKINDYESLSNILEECIYDWKIRKRQVRFLVPDACVIIRKVNIPLDVKDDEIKGYLYLELGSSIHLPFEEPVFDAVVLSKNNDKKEILIFAAPEERVMEYSNLFTELKLTPVSAEVSPLALYRLYYHLGQTNIDEQIMAVQFDITTVNISIFDKHVPILMHHLQPEFLEENWHFKLNQDGVYELNYIGNTNTFNYQFEDIYKEISKLMDFYRYTLNHGKKSVTKILVIGDHPLISLIITELEGRFDVSVETVQNETFLNDKNEALPLSHYLALGLALKEV
ncbi:pilus assembly protein PilM (plasmid) [Bacillus sp. 31A1R]|uniref:Pilus assembly protein PilM n=1 Tax=Robertmurraya mangrovi TaxID=3098077 RepID=A0ABU5IUI1_9BACI|nr:pilus assembly protein PilM [Bacillus sp. 31A1R]MDZ5470809.1 pilus assembly protein PilM [Bacillus sp. 31A1R]